MVIKVYCYTVQIYTLESDYIEKVLFLPFKCKKEVRKYYEKKYGTKTLNISVTSRSFEMSLEFVDRVNNMFIC